MPEPDKVFNDGTEVIVLYPDQENRDDQEIVFWFKEKDKLRIDGKKFIDLLNHLGFRIYFIGKDYLLVHIENNIADDIAPVQMKNKVKEYIMDPVRNYEDDITAEMVLGKGN